MRVIVNIHSRDVVEIADWRAKAVQINNKHESHLKEVLDTVVINSATALADILLNGDRLNDKYLVFVNGIQLPDTPDLETRIRDNVQIHLFDRR
jgi:predicted naringenin-chalcone synthase